MVTDCITDQLSAHLSPNLVAELKELDQAGLRVVRAYAEQRLASLQPSLKDQIEAAPGEEILKIIEHESQSLIVKKEPCMEECENCPHGPYLYRVRRAFQPNGESELQWSYLGTMVDETEGS